MDWTEIKIEVSASDLDRAGDIANMTVPYGIYIEDYRELEAEALQIAHIDLIDEELLNRDRSIGIIHVYISPDASPAEAVAYLSERFNAENIKHSIAQLACAAEDWRSIWKTFYKPIPVGERLLICPAWETPDDIGGRAVFRIEPGLAFGSGEHETTRLCLETVEKYDLSGKRVLDVGCGSGVLSVCSLLLGAKDATGVDIDKTSVRTARENAELNGFGEPEFRAICGNLADSVTGEFDVIFANIVADAVIMLCGDIGHLLAPGGIFIASGIIDLREDDVCRAFKAADLRVRERREDGGWLCFTLEK